MLDAATKYKGWIPACSRKNVSFINTPTSEPKSQLATPYKLKKGKKAEKKDSSSETLIDPDLVSVIEAAKVKQPPAGAVDTVRPFLSKTTPTDKAPVQQKQVPTTSPAMSPHRPD